jgi:hypothetical protein
MKMLLFGMKEKKRGKDEAKNRAEESRSGVGESSQSDSPKFKDFDFALIFAFGYLRKFYAVVCRYRLKSRRRLSHFTFNTTKVMSSFCGVPFAQ